MLLSMIEDLIEHHMDLNNPIDFLIVTMSLISHNGLLRAKELLSGIKAGDCIWNHKARYVDINIGPTKTERVGCGVWIRITAYDNRPCAYKYLYRWFITYDLWNNKKYFIFPYYFHTTINRKAYFEFQMKASTKWWENAIELLGNRLGKQLHQMSKHSFRAGGCTDLFSLGVSYATIKKYGRWKSDAVLLYFRDESLVSNTVAKAFGRGYYEQEDRGLPDMGVFDNEDL